MNVRVKENERESLPETRKSSRDKNLPEPRRNNRKTQNPAAKKHTAPYTHKSKRRRKANRDKLKVIPIGGLGEIGKNMTVFEYKNQAVIVDCGLMFPDDDMLGVDIVLPDFEYVRNNKDKIKGLIVTHGHEDHIGGIAYLLKEANIPVYATRFTMGLIEKKLNEHNLLSHADLNVIKAGEKFKLGDFDIEPIRVNHSIADSVAFCIKTPAATVLHTGDFKIDYQPIDGEIMDLQRISELGAEGVDLLMADSTNVEEAGFTPSESSVGETFYQLFRGSKNRIIVTTFASNVHRVQQIIDAAAAYNRKVIVTGRSMENMVEVATDLGYLNIPKNTLIDIKDMNKFKPKELVVITTGSQGEPMAALGRMANGEHRYLNVGKGDTVIISASPVPGNEKMVADVINRLVDLGSDVVYKKFADIHVSGHAKREELKLLQVLVKPKYFMPIHGESRMLLHHGTLAESLGQNPKNIFIMENGKELELDHFSARVAEDTVPAEAVLVDGLGVGDIGNIVLNDRRKLSEDGLFIVVCKMKNGRAVATPDIISRGFVYVKESESLMNQARKQIEDVLKKCEDKGITDWADIKSEIRETLYRFLFKKTQRKPMILPILINV
ncbi:MAG: ribonuclease J [Eubacteriaceae bacterium]|jgi:ribonuclease J